MQEFNHGLVMSCAPLLDNQMFEVRIDKKINSWSGSIEVGVTSCDPNTLDAPFPSRYDNYWSLVLAVICNMST